MTTADATAAGEGAAARTLLAQWQNAWPQALAAWSRFTKLSHPRWCFSEADEKEHGLSGSFAMIRLDDHAVVISLRQIAEQGLTKFAPEILAHEIGHHVYAPGDLTDHARMLARMRAALPDREDDAGMVGNLYTDLLINDRLQRVAELRIAEVYAALSHAWRGRAGHLWSFYMRIYEVLWRLKPGTFVASKDDALFEHDAQLGAKLIRVYRRDWLAGAAKFAALCYPYLAKDESTALRRVLVPLLDAERPTAGTIPSGLTELEADEIGDVLHPREDPALGGYADEGGEDREDGTAESQGGKGPNDEYRGPADYRDLLRSIGVTLSDDDLTIRYYRERALPHIVPFPEQVLDVTAEPLPEGLEDWEFGAPIEEIDWLESVIASPQVIPGLTTRRRVYGQVEGSERDSVAVDLFLGVDCSGSMMNPKRGVSFPVLGGAIIALSALRAGAKVMVTLSGEPGRHSSTDGFVEDETAILRALTGYHGTGYTFAIPRLVDAFPEEAQRDRPAHILIVTDSDIYRMLEGKDGKVGDKSGWQVALDCLQRAAGGGTMLLHANAKAHQDKVKRLRGQGWAVHHITRWEDVVAFAARFAEAAYANPRGRR